MKTDRFSLKSVAAGDSRLLFDIAIALTSVIPALAFGVMLFHSGNDVIAGMRVWLLVIVMILMMAGYVILLKYPRNIAKLRRYLENMVQGQMPEKIALLRTENDIGAIEDSLNLILEKLKTDLDRSEEEREVLVKQLTQAQKLESIGAMAAGIAHEINTPVQYVSDNTRFLKKSYENILELIQEYRELLQVQAERSGDRELSDRLRTLDDKLDVSFMQRELPHALAESLEGLASVARIVMAMKDFSYLGRYDEIVAADINKAVQSTVTVSRNEWKYVADIETELEMGLPTVDCYVGDIKQAVLNLIVNAAQAISEKVGKSGEKGIITIRTESDSKWVIIRVSDNGCGISADVRERIFEPFFTTKPPGVGTGQGLAIVYSLIVGKNQGVVDVNSREGQGSEFVLRLSRSGIRHLGKELNEKTRTE
jgi:signal transduction histidine kinase